MIEMGSMMVKIDHERSHVARLTVDT